MSLYHIIYVSKGVDIDENKLDDILNTARDFNANNDITGMLLYIEGKFFQVLEGDEKVLNQLYAKIRLDKRHEQVTTVSAHSIPYRTFKDWSMRFKAISEKDFYNLSGISSWQSLLALKPGPKENIAYVFSRKFTDKTFPSVNWWHG